MKIFQFKLHSKSDVGKLNIPFVPDVLFLFVSLSFDDVENTMEEIKKKFTDTIIIGGTTVGEIINNTVIDGTIAMSAVKFKSTRLHLYSTILPTDGFSNYQTGVEFANKIDQNGLKHLFLLSDLQTLNASNLLKGINERLLPEIGVSGGLAGRNSYVDSNYIIENGEIKRNRVIALAMYGESLQVSYNAQGGWDSYGVECLVTKSYKNHLLEIDGRPALDFYKSHVDAAIVNNIKDEGFKHPIKVRNENHSNPVIRVVLAVDEDEKSLIMSEELPMGSYVRLMKSNIDRLIKGAENASKIIAEQSNHEHQLAILISCAGRRKVLGNLVAEEVEATMGQFTPQTKSIGFYSYGEISPFFKIPKTSLHNLTMCVTTFSEL